MDSSFFTKYEDYLDNIENPGDQVKDFFEPGVPAELVRASRKTSTSTTRFVFINFIIFFKVHTLPFKMFGPFRSVWCKMALAEVGVSLP